MRACAQRSKDRVFDAAALRRSQAEDGHRPLVYSFGGLAADDEPLAIGRRGGRSRLAAPGAHAVAGDGAGDGAGAGASTPACPPREAWGGCEHRQAFASAAARLPSPRSAGAQLAAKPAVSAAEVAYELPPLPVCGDTALFNADPAYPEHPCPARQYYGEGAGPWVVGQPPTHPCPSCALNWIPNVVDSTYSGGSCRAHGKAGTSLCPSSNYCRQLLSLINGRSARRSRILVSARRERHMERTEPRSLSLAGPPPRS